MYAQLTGACIFLLGCTILAPRYGYAGIAIAYDVTMTSNVIFLCIYIKTTGCVKESWIPWDPRALQELWSFLKVVFPIMMIGFTESMGYFINFLFVGWLNDEIQMAAHQIVASIADVFWVVQMGTELSLITFVGNSAGAGLVHTTQNYAKSGVCIGVVLLLFNWLIIFLLKDYLGE